MLLKKDNYCVSEENENYILSVYSYIGDREEQQDCAGYSFGLNSGMVVLCDGMGGHANGKQASNTAVEEMLKQSSISTIGQHVHESLCDATKLLNAKVKAITDENGNWAKAGTTLVTVVLSDSKMYWISVGDSRIYLHRNETLTQLNEDHTYSRVLDEMLRSNAISRDEYDLKMENGDALISFLGVKNLSIWDGNKEPVYLASGDKILLMSDGLYKIISDKEVCAIINNFTDISDALRTLELKVKSRAKQKGQIRDNMTLALIKVK